MSAKTGFNIALTIILCLVIFYSVLWANLDHKPTPVSTQNIKSHPRIWPETYTTRSPGQATDDVDITPNDNIKIQWRTTVFGGDPLVVFGGGKSDFDNCPVKHCEVIPMESNVTPHVLMFHARDSPVFPQHRFPYQKYVFFTAESEVNQRPRESEREIFNLTMTHRLDSDVPIPYGEVVEKSFDQESVFERTVNFATGKSKQVAWVVSSCRTSSRREDYIKELGKYIQVDIYGDCGKPCDRNGACMSMINHTYKFYLSFENSICQDYLTEKVYSIMIMGGMIPVVMGGANYSKLLPPHSVINALDFPSPHNLAEYLHKLDKNDKLYNEYFNWRKYYFLDPNSFPWISHKFWCRLCEYLHSNRGKIKTYADMGVWYSTRTRCSQPPTWTKNINS